MKMYELANPIHEIMDCIESQIASVHPAASSGA